MSKTPRRPRAVPFTIRPARSADKKSVLAFTKDTFGEFRDYIPFIWGRWLKDRGGYFWVAESRGRAVGIAKLTFHSPDEAWMEGLRVNPHQRSKGIAHALHKECLDAAAGRKVRVVRFATNSENTPIHHLAAEFGFQRAASFAYFFAEPQAGEARPPFVMSPELLPQVHKFIWDSDFRKASAGLVGLHDISWVWKELTEERIKEHLQKGEVLA
ncbi:MAG: GNAT family N-acetyltransferase, partial [Chloroflexi bacterium]|nr:GNAT family N-acetyltransferase [Chloroflexota bacterium]